MLPQHLSKFRNHFAACWAPLLRSVGPRPVCYTESRTALGGNRRRFYPTCTHSTISTIQRSKQESRTARGGGFTLAQLVLTLPLRLDQTRSFDLLPSNPKDQNKRLPWGGRGGGFTPPLHCLGLPRSDSIV